MVLVLTDVQGSTKLWQDEPAAMDAAMIRHHEIVHGAVKDHDGWRPVDQGEGDAVFAAFRSATSALAAAVQVQRFLAAEPWPTTVPLQVRIGVHLGEVTERGGNLFGDPVNRCARLRGLGHGGQTLLSAPVYELVRDKLPEGAALLDLGEHRMKDLVRPEHVWQLNLDGLPTDFPPLASLDRALHNLPVQRAQLIGGDTELAAVLEALDTHRLVTLTGFGGMGKTRLALQAAAELADGDGDGVWFVDLAGATDPAAVPGLIGHVTGLGGSDAESVINSMAGHRLLLVLDNLEQVLGAAPFISQLLDQVAGVKVLATSREPLRLRGEKELALSPLALPPAGEVADAATLSTYAAVQLFVERAVDVKADFSVTNDNAPAVAAICQRLDGHPLAIELAAARVRMMTPQALLPRLDQALSVLTGGGRDLPGRQQTLRATIAWSYDLLEAEERLLLDRLSVFAGPVSFDLVEAVCGQDLDVFSALASLVEKSLVRTSLSDDDQDLYGTLVSIRAYAAEQLAASGAEESVLDRHAAQVLQETALRSPYTMSEVLHRRRRVAALYDELTKAWAHVQHRGDQATARSFPVPWFEMVYQRTNDTAALDLVIANSDEPTMQLAFALHCRMFITAQAGLHPSEALSTRLRDVAEAMGQPEGLMLALMDIKEVTGKSEEELLDLVARLDALLAQVRPDSPHSREFMRVYRDNLAFIAMQFIDPDLAEAAAVRNHENDPDDSISLHNLAQHYLIYGRWQEVVDVMAAAIARGPVRTGFMYTHAAVTLAARALVELGRPQEALDLLSPWAAEAVRRGWQLSIEFDASARVSALLALGRADEALALLRGLPHPVIRPLTKVLKLRVDRLTGQSLDPSEPAALAEVWEAAKSQLVLAYLAALVEQALREQTPEARRVLLERIAELDGPYLLPVGYQQDLDRLRADS